MLSLNGMKPCNTLLSMLFTSFFLLGPVLYLVQALSLTDQFLHLSIVDQRPSTNSICHTFRASPKIIPFARYRLADDLHPSFFFVNNGPLQNDRSRDLWGSWANSIVLMWSFLVFHFGLSVLSALCLQY